MGTVRADIVVEIHYDLKKPEQTIIKTNARKEALEEILEAWLLDQVGRGQDGRQPARRDVYLVRIGLDLSDDTFFTESDTGNSALTCGLIMDVLARLEKLSVLPLGAG